MEVDSLDSLAVDLAFAYDLDALVLAPDGSFVLDHPIHLCRGPFPCQLRLEGGGLEGAALEVVGPGRLECDKLDACSLLSLSSVRLVCNGLLAAAPLAVSSGAHASLSGSRFSSCHSLSHGGVLVLAAHSTANVSACSFESVGSNASGGAIFADRAELWIADSTFRGCSAGAHGGSVLSSGRLHVRDTRFEESSAGGEGGGICGILGAQLSARDTTFDNCRSALGGGAITSLGPLDLHSCTFRQCWSAGAGGGIRVAESDDMLAPAAPVVSVVSSAWSNCSSEQRGGAIACDRGSLSVEDSSFSSNSARADGGGLSIQNGSVVVASSRLEHNLAGGMGGALSIRGGSVSIASSSLMHNEARGLGGGALHVQDARSELEDLAASNNRAEAGGGGVLLWQGAEPVIRRWNGRLCGAACPPGTVAGAAAECEPCAPGTHKPRAGVGGCVECEAGSFAREGAAHCQRCPPHSTAPARSTASANCTCDPGFTGPSGGPCVACAAGTYKGGQGSGACHACLPPL
eukprot:1989018-Rhodomonas_salina.1